MNKLLTTTSGQMPIYLDDFRFLDAIYREGIENIVKTYANNQNCILYGCEITNVAGGVQVNNGAIWYQNEMFAFVGGTLTGTGIPCFQIEEITQSPRIFGNGQTHNAHLIRRMICINGTTNKIADLKTFAQLVKDHSNDTEDWKPVPFTTGDYYTDPTNPLLYRKIMNGKMVHIRGNFYIKPDANFDDFAVLTSRPAVKIANVVPLEEGTAGEGIISINTAGYVRYNGTLGTIANVNIMYAVD